MEGTHRWVVQIKFSYNENIELWCCLFSILKDVPTAVCSFVIYFSINNSVSASNVISRHYNRNVTQNGDGTSAISRKEVSAAIRELVCTSYREMDIDREELALRKKYYCTSQH